MDYHKVQMNKKKIYSKIKILLHMILQQKYIQKWLLKRIQMMNLFVPKETIEEYMMEIYKDLGGLDFDDLPNFYTKL